MTRRLVRLLIAATLIALAIAGWLVSPMFSSPTPSVLTELGELSSLDTLVPFDATDVAIVPDFAPFYFTSRKHPFARALIDRTFPDANATGLALILGRATVIAWRVDDHVSLVARPSPARRRLLGFLAGLLPFDLSIDGDWVRVSASAQQGLSTIAREFRELAPGVRGLAFLLARDGSDLRLPSLALPALSALSFEGGSIRIDSRAKNALPLQHRDPIPFPASAPISIYVAAMPEVVSEIDRAFPLALEQWISEGALFVIYDVEERALLPRPFGLIVSRADALRASQLERRLDEIALPGALEILGGIAQATRTVEGVVIRRRTGPGFTVESAHTNGLFLLSFDKRAIEIYLADSPVPVRTEKVAWSARVEPKDLIPILSEMRDSEGLRFVAPKLSRSVRRLHQFSPALAAAGTIEASCSQLGPFQTLTITVRANR